VAQTIHHQEPGIMPGKTKGLEYQVTKSTGMEETRARGKGKEKEWKAAKEQAGAGANFLFGSIS